MNKKKSPKTLLRVYLLAGRCCVCVVALDPGAARARARRIVRGSGWESGGSNEEQDANIMFGWAATRNRSKPNVRTSRSGTGGADET